jgi:hypothetical protein
VQRTRSFRRRAAHVNNSLYKFPKTVEKRNARERTRVHTVNQAFHMLKYRIPSIKSNAKRVSKLKILRAAINHIYSLSDLLEVSSMCFELQGSILYLISDKCEVISDK